MHFRPRKKPSEQLAQEPVEETLEELLKEVREQLEENKQQSRHEASRDKPHWKKKKQKPGPKQTIKEEDEQLLEGFPDGQVYASNHDQYFLIFLFSVSTLFETDQAGKSLEIQRTHATFPSQGGRYEEMPMARMHLCKDIY